MIGSGGVGKTTSSVTCAVLAASQGRKVGLLSIDPAKRLADAMGISLGNELCEISPIEGAENWGSLYAAMLDQKAVFDSMVSKFAKNQVARDKIFENPLYQQVSSNFGGPLEYMALAKISEMLEDDRFDLIVVDTPPDTHALDFLIRPGLLAGFMDKKVMNWLVKPFHMAQKLGFTRLLSVGERMMQGIADLTGAKMLHMIAEFLILAEEVIIGFNESGKNITAALSKDGCHFVLVTAPTNVSVRSADVLMKELVENKFQLSAIIANRYVRQDLREALEKMRENLPREKLQTEEFLFKMLDGYNNSLKNLQEISKRYFRNSPPIALVEEQSAALHTPSAILSFSELFKNAKNLGET